MEMTQEQGVLCVSVCICARLSLYLFVSVCVCVCGCVCVCACVFHTWLIKKAVNAAVYAVPSRESLLKSMEMTKEQGVCVRFMYAQRVCVCVCARAPVPMYASYCVRAGSRA